MTSLLTFNSYDKLIKDTTYGLATGAIKKDCELKKNVRHHDAWCPYILVTRAFQFGNQLQVDSVWANQYNVNTLQAPFDGFKKSVLCREFGLYV